VGVGLLCFFFALLGFSVLPLCCACFAVVSRTCVEVAVRFPNARADKALTGLYYSCDVDRGCLRAISVYGCRGWRWEMICYMRDG